MVILMFRTLMQGSCVLVGAASRAIGSERKHKLNPPWVRLLLWSVNYLSWRCHTKKVRQAAETGFWLSITDYGGPGGRRQQALEPLKTSVVHLSHMNLRGAEEDMCRCATRRSSHTTKHLHPTDHTGCGQPARRLAKVLPYLIRHTLWALAAVLIIATLFFFFCIIVQRK